MWPPSSDSEIFTSLALIGAPAVPAGSHATVLVEPAVQAWASGSTVLIDAASWIYINAQTTVCLSALAYLYFFPQGYTERAQITVRQGNNVWTLLISPLTGKTSIVDGEPEVPRS